DGRSSPDATPRSPRASPTPSGCRGRAARPRTPASSPPGTGLPGSCGGGARYACTASKSSSQVLAAGPSSYSSDLPMPHAADLCTNAHIHGSYSDASQGGFRVVTAHQPVGPCLLITPWNFPLLMIVCK